MSDQENEKKSFFSSLNPFNKKDKTPSSSAFNLNNDESMQASHEVIESIAHNAAESVKGVQGLRDGVFEKATSLFSRKSSGKGVVVTEVSGKLNADVFLYVDYGVNVVKVARNVQEAVKTELSATTELPIGDINVHVLDIVPEKPKPKEVDANHLFDKKPESSSKKTTKPKSVTKTKSTTSKRSSTTSKKNSKKDE